MESGRSEGACAAIEHAQIGAPAGGDDQPEGGVVQLTTAAKTLTAMTG